MRGVTLTRRGTAAQQPLVLVHGWGFDASAWQSWLPSLEPDYAVQIVTLPGVTAGDSIRLDDIDTVADQLAEQIEQPAVWVGWSLGGIVAAAVAARHPDRVQALLTLATNPCFVATDVWPGMTPATFDAFYNGIGADAVKTLGRFLLLQGQGDRAAKLVVRELKPALAVEADPAALRAGLDRLAEDHRGYFDHLAMPCRFLFGGGDALVPAAVAEQAPLATRAQVIEGCGHTLFISAMERVTAELAALSRQAAGRA